MALLLTNTDDTPITGTTFTLQRGVASAKKTVKIKNMGAFAEADRYVNLIAETAPGSGNYATSGSPATDERMGRFEITGQDSTASPGQQIVLGQVQVVGHLAVALLPTILPGDWIIADVWLAQGTSSANTAAFNCKFDLPPTGEKAFPIAQGVSEFAHGVLTGVNQPESAILTGRATTPTGTPDDKVHTAAGSWLLNGAEYTDASIRDSTLNQNDGAAAALAAGQKYVAVLTQSTANAPTVTKGLKGTAPSRPTPPTGEIILAWVTVSYQSGGTSIIASADISADLTYGRLLVTAPATGLTVTVHAGRAIGEGFMQIHAEKETVTGLSASATNRIWLDVDGTVVKTLSDTPPHPGAHWLANAVTSGTAVTSLVDKRTFISPAGITLAAHAASHATAGGDPVSPASIGASAIGHAHAESDVTGLVTDLAAKAPLASPALTGNPTAPSQSANDSSTKVATTAFVQAELLGSIATKTGAYTATVDDDTILCDATGAAFTVALFAAAAKSGKVLRLKKIDSSVNAVTIDANASETIDGALTKSLAAQWDTIRIQSNGTAWFVI